MTSWSQPNQINNSVPQGSNLAPLLFIIFINDLPYVKHYFDTVLFADDTTLELSGYDIKSIISKAETGFSIFMQWCEMNRLDVNWSKTSAMFITNKHISHYDEIKKIRTNGLEIPSQIKLQGISIQVVDRFELLGIMIDRRLQFQHHINKIKKHVNIRVFSIKKMSYLSFSVKLQ